MKQPVYKADPEAVKKDFPIFGPVPGWYFRVKKLSADSCRAEGRDLWNRRVSRTGSDARELIELCEADAEEILKLNPEAPESESPPTEESEQRK